MASAATAGLGFFRTTKLNGLGRSPRCELDCVLVDLKRHCVLRESLEGYRAALTDQHSYVTNERIESRWRCRIAIIPGAGLIDAAAARLLCDLLESGSHVLLESGGGFLSATEFAAHQRMLHRYFALTIEPPVNLWSQDSIEDVVGLPKPRQMKKADSGRCTPYVHYVWPREIRVRDFSRAIPVLAKEEDVIGRVGRSAVALRRGQRNGTLIFLGSPLGPALRAGDPEALSWLRSVIAL